MIVKNSYGSSLVPNPKFMNPDLIGEFAGSSLNRKKEERQKPTSKEDEKTVTQDEKKEKWRSLSSRTKSKIRKKLYSFFGLHKRLTFLTLTFCNEVNDKVAVSVLSKFLENQKKKSKDFEFLWVAERQTKNPIFKDNIHFHIVTNKFWDIKKCWKYWLDLQAKHGIKPRESSYNPSSAFDVKTISGRNAKGIGSYLTKYVVKNSDKFLCQVWNCSKRVSQLFTDFYTDFSFLNEVERLEKAKELEIKRVKHEYCNAFFYPITKSTIRFYDKLHTKNKELWN